MLTISVVSPYWALSVNFLLAYWTIDCASGQKNMVFMLRHRGAFGKAGHNSIFVLTSLIQHFLNHGKSLYVAFIDFSKAFDYVVRENLWFKLVNAGMSGKILEIIKSMYYVVKTQIVFQGEKSEPVMSLLGVRQGDCLSPFLFAMYINDLEQTLSQENVEGIQFGFFKLFLLLYADDITILAETPQGLQKSLDELRTYCMKWKLQVNTNKSMVMVFKRGRRRQNEHWSYGGTEMKCSHTATYLGLTLTPGGSFATTQKTLAEQASKAQFQLNVTCTNSKIFHLLLCTIYLWKWNFLYWIMPVRFGVSIAHQI